jgi:hypothetical protein
MLLHIDGSKQRWFSDDRYYDLLVILDDAPSEIYYAQLVQEESTRTVMAALREVIEAKGLFCALYSDRGRHFFVTRKAGEKVDPSWRCTSIRQSRWKRRSSSASTSTSIYCITPRMWSGCGTTFVRNAARRWAIAK